MLSALVTIIVHFSLGYWMHRTRRFPDNTAEVLNRIVIDICLPATILRLVPGLSFDPSLFVLVVTPWLIAGLAYGAARIIGRLLELDPQTRTALFLVTALGNTSFLGFPLVGALVGESAVPLAAVYDQTGSFLLLSLVAPLAISTVTTGYRPPLLELLTRILRFPPFLALLVALLPFPQPAFLNPVLQAASAPLVPLAMLAVGFKLRVTTPQPVRVFAWGMTLKLVLLPLASWAVAVAFGAPRDVLVVSVLETAMPTMITVGALLMANGIAPELVAAFVGWGLLLSLVSLPLWALILQS